MRIIRTVAEMQSWADQERRSGKRIGFVPTMGCLHEGHLSLVRIARARSDSVVVSIFVNPIQFGPAEDLARYPRDLDRDCALLEKEHVDLIYHPDAQEMYAQDYSTYIDVEQLTEKLCGERRPGHFRGVATVVAKLFNAVKPHLAVFGAKDAQQAYVIRRMTRDLDFGVEIIITPTVRASDGLALSSRNAYLSAEERAQAPVLHRSLQRAAQMIAQGERDPKTVIEAMREMIVAVPDSQFAIRLEPYPQITQIPIRTSDSVSISVHQRASAVSASLPQIDYISIVDTATLHEASEIRGEVLIAVAVFFGPTRLIDNIVVNG